MTDPATARPVRPLWKTWGERMRAVRETPPKLSQFELATKVGVRPQQISDMERGIARGTDETRLKIAEALGADPNWLWAYPTEGSEATA